MEGSLSPQQAAELLGTAGIPPAQGDGTLTGEPVLIFMQVPTAEGAGYAYVYLSSQGVVLARAAEHVGGSPDPDEASWSELFDHMQTEVVSVRDAAGTPVFAVSHKKVLKSEVTVADAHGRTMGTMRQRNILGRVRFSIEAAGHDYGSFVAATTQMLGFDVRDPADNVVGRLVKVGQLYGVRSPMGLGHAKVPACFVLQLFQRPPLPLLTAAMPIVLDLSMNLDSVTSRATKRGPTA
ncbi:hypothetical protein [Georgenia alba]|uniref:Uncharacterized protein n=1 Tax=Georgenia alba TaxID=2233858 RepID=A0ABW2Q3N2_9MICO